MSDIVLVDATTLIALGNVGRVDLLGNFDGDLLVPEVVAKEVVTEPAKSNVKSFFQDHHFAPYHGVSSENWSEAGKLLDAESDDGDVHLVGNLLELRAADYETAVVSDDRRVRTVARGLGATVTGTVGVVVRSVHEGMDADDGKDLIREIDSHGLHMTGELREKAYELIDKVGEN